MSCIILKISMGNTTYMIVIIFHFALFQLLLKYNCKVDHADIEGWTALRAAAWGGHSQVMNTY